MKRHFVMLAAALVWLPNAAATGREILDVYGTPHRASAAPQAIYVQLSNSAEMAQLVEMLGEENAYEAVRMYNSGELYDGMVVDDHTANYGDVSYGPAPAHYHGSCCTCQRCCDRPGLAKRCFECLRRLCEKLCFWKHNYCCPSSYCYRQTAENCCPTSCLPPRWWCRPRSCSPCGHTCYERSCPYCESDAAYGAVSYSDGGATGVYTGRPVSRGTYRVEIGPAGDYPEETPAPMPRPNG